MNIIFDFCKNVWHSFVKLKGEATFSNNKHKKNPGSGISEMWSAIFVL